MNYDLNAVIRELNALLEEGIVETYAIGGAVAVGFYGEPAATEDVDVFVIFKDRDSSLIIDPSPVIDFLKARGYEVEKEYIRIGGWPVQFLPPPTALEEDALKHAVVMEDGDLFVRVLSLVYLAAIALQTGRSKDHNRLIAIRSDGTLDIPEFEAIISSHELEDKWRSHLDKFPDEA